MRCCILFVLMLTTIALVNPALSQLVPLILDQTIELPSTSDVWDVMPHPNGSYLWVQAVEPATGEIKLFWANSDSVGWDSITFVGGDLQTFVCYWSTDYQPAIVLSRRNGSDYQQSHRVQAFRLTDSQPISPEMSWSPAPFRNTYFYLTDHKLALCVPLPPPPQVSTSVPAIITWHMRVESEYSGIHTTSNGDPTEIYRDLLFSDSALSGIVGSSCFHAWSWDGEAVHWGYTGVSSASISGPGGWSFSIFRHTGLVDFTEDTIRSPWSLMCSDTGNSPCFRTVLQGTYTDHAILFGDLPSGMIGAVDSTGELWRLQASGSLLLTAETVSSSAGEELLLYEGSLHRFRIFGALDGHNYGVTDSLNTTSGARIIGRYDSTFRRLAVRDGNTLKLYRFGEYLAADEHPVQLPSDLNLAVFPNPFNPSATIHFSLLRSVEAELVVYDITGRKVSVLVNGVLAAGEHRAHFDGSVLPSGIYFARLQTADISATQKLLLLK